MTVSLRMYDIFRSSYKTQMMFMIYFREMQHQCIDDRFTNDSLSKYMSSQIPHKVHILVVDK
jgi:hypothetical protein